MFCMGDDDRQHRDKDGVKGVHHSHQPVKGKMYRAGAALDRQPSVMCKVNRQK